LTIDRDKEKLRNEVKNMRERMLKELDKSGKDGFDLKQGKGGIIDIEFIVQYLTLLHAGNNYSFKLWTDVVRLLGSMVENQILDEYAAFTLRNAYLIYRSYIHKLNLQKLPKILKDEQFLVQRKKIIALYERLLQ
jgi:glutamate-ammonia-ligase adenylyltransferase